MTKKRFKINTSEIGHIYIDNPDGEHMTWRMMEDTLNQLLEENEQLNLNIDEYKRVAKSVKEENEQLKTVIGRYDFSVARKNDEINNLHFDYLKLEKENEQLRREKGKLEVEIEVLSDELAQCKAVIDKRWNEYLEKKGDFE